MSALREKNKRGISLDFLQMICHPIIYSYLN